MRLPRYKYVVRGTNTTGYRWCQIFTQRREAERCRRAEIALLRRYMRDGTLAGVVTNDTLKRCVRSITLRRALFSTEVKR